jgi:hypothetical protein
MVVDTLLEDEERPQQEQQIEAMKKAHFVRRM